MVNTQKITEWIKDTLQECHVQLYEIQFLPSENTLQIAIGDEMGNMDLDTCALVSEKVGEILDQHDLECGEYMLEICSPGAERPILNLDEIPLDTPIYVYVQFKNGVAGMNEVYGYLYERTVSSIWIQYMQKAVKKKIEIEKDNIAFIRHAVKV